MKGIMFNTRYGLEQAVLRGDKTRTWRADKKPRYDVGEIVAIKQSYETIFKASKFLKEKASSIVRDALMLPNFTTSPGWHNKMFVRNDLMPHKIRITKVTPCKLQDITDDECMNEGIDQLIEIGYFYFEDKDREQGFYKETPKGAFKLLINKLNGKGYWDANPMGYAYEFELIK